MPDSSTCLSAQASLEEIRSLKQEFGVAYDLAISLGKSEDILKAQGLKRGLSEKTQALQERVNTSLAPEIMGRNFLGISQVEEHLGILTHEQKEALATIPFSLETLRECADTHVLIADIGTSILDLEQKYIGAFHRHSMLEVRGKDFAKRTQDACWRLIHKSAVEDSFSRNWSDQQSLIDPEIEEIPSARQVIYTMILHTPRHGGASVRGDRRPH
ncbi:hypothetical protein EPN81_02180 [Patescibacteria group bacterium]|nr:MAG: hypothetical protein EPN81_02180 [Patescibacteria group bacterium]